MGATALVRPPTQPTRPIVVFGVLAFVLALRVMHLSSALQSPLSYQPGPDEDYYLRFGRAVASGHGAEAPEFTFMDPGYGYLLGGVFKLLGVNPFAIYLLQALLDTATAFGILTLGRLLDRPRAGLYGALLYGVTSTAIMFCATLLKETCVAGYLTWWVVGAMALGRSAHALAWKETRVAGSSKVVGATALGRSAHALAWKETRVAGSSKVVGATALGRSAHALAWKETRVAGSSKVVGATALGRSAHALAWVAFGVYCGLGIALRSTLLLLAGLAMLLPAFQRGIPGTDWVRKSALLLGGLVLSLLPWSMRNFQADGSLSPLPHNGGIVLHQAYNADNPESAIWIPPFVSYSHPSEIWRGYAAEADRREGHDLSPPQVDAYWKDQAMAFMSAHPIDVMEHVTRKALKFLADTEVPNNRSSAEERLFSPVLRFLPRPDTWLLAMGLAGLVWLATQDRRWLIVAAPIAISWLTVAVFWAEDRFRFHAMPMLVFCSGIWIDGMVSEVRRLGKAREVRGTVMATETRSTEMGGGSLGTGTATGTRDTETGDEGASTGTVAAARSIEVGEGVGTGMVSGQHGFRRWSLPAFAVLAALIGAASLYLGREYPPPVVRWDHVVWGYIKMGKPREAQGLAERVVLEQPDNGPIIEALGYLAAVGGRYDEAVSRYRRAVELRPNSYLAHYNLAKALLALGQRDGAAAEARASLSLSPSPDAQSLLQQAETAP